MVNNNQPIGNIAIPIDPVSGRGETPSLNGSFSLMARAGYLVLAFIFGYSLILNSFFSIRLGFPKSIPTYMFVAVCVIFAAAIRMRLFQKLWSKPIHLSCKSIFIIALVLRLVYVLLSGVEQTTDFLQYDQMALDILGGKYILHWEKPTGPSLFFALHYLFFGHITLLPQISQAILSALQVLLVYVIVVRTTKNKDAGKLAAIVLAFWPEHIVYTNLLGSEVLYTTFTLTTVWLLSPSIKRYSLAAFIAALCLGIAQWMRPTAVLFAVVGLIFVTSTSWVLAGWRACFKATLAFICGFMLLVSPIILLNYHALGVASPTPSQMGGWSLMIGTNTQSRGTYLEKDWHFLREQIQQRTPRKGENHHVFSDRVAREIGFERLTSQPLKILYMGFIHKIPHLWGGHSGVGWSMLTSRFHGIYLYATGLAKVWHLLALMMCVLVLFARSKRKCPWDERQIYVYTILLTTFVHMLLESQPRYHCVFLPFLAMCLGEAIIVFRLRKEEK